MKYLIAILFIFFGCNDNKEYTVCSSHLEQFKLNISYFDNEGINISSGYIFDNDDTVLGSDAESCSMNYCPLHIVYDVWGESNFGWWKVYVSKFNDLIVEYNDVDTYNGFKWVFKDSCKRY